ncbi:HD domain-containing phosphohydrolase [Roseospirillum parvum]|uniref:PAS fold-containing protein n=1 Tax=Roseospirillum parvum TaxID=83401 RepID=A0A1G7TJA9_9PROT|nr:HD domain-containing phosphohydrolase [Roseospirillum parvum]SDG35398.1 PAS fold-containing protein [Roseospirillum parvum]
MSTVDRPLEDLPAPPNAHRGRRERRRAWLIAGLTGAAALAVGLGGTLYTVSTEKERLISAAASRAEAVLETRGHLVRNWLTTRRQGLGALAETESLRLIAAEVAGGAGQGLDTELTFLSRALEEQARALDAQTLQLLTPDGQVWLVSGGGAPFEPQIKAAAVTVADSGESRAMPAPAEAAEAAEESSSPAIDLLVPVPPLQGQTAPVGVLAGRLPAGALLDEVAVPGALARPGERLTVTLDAQPVDAKAGFTQHPGNPPLFTLTRPLAELPWTLTYAIPVTTVISPAQGSLFVGLALSVFAAGAVASLVMAALWRQATDNQRRLATQYQTMAGRIADQRALLNTIIDAIPEYLFVTDTRGVLHYANAAVGELVEASHDEITGRTLADVLDDPTAATTILGAARPGAGARQVACALFGQPRWLSVSQSQVDFDDGQGGTVTRWVTLAQDVTEAVLNRQHRERLQHSIMRTLGRTVAAVDPFLADQAAKLEQVALALAERLEVSEDERLTLELTARVSQIGKLFVSRELLTKTSRLTDAERAELESHVDHARTLLGDLETDLPIAATLAEMSERLDGTGYPDGLGGEDISRAGRILGVADVFVARTSERAHRKANRAEDVLDILAQHPGRYDADVVEALKALIDQGHLANGNGNGNGNGSNAY